LRAVHLVDGHFVEAPLEGVEAGLDGQEQHVEGDAVFDVEVGGAEGLELCERRAQVCFFGGSSGRADVWQAIVVAIVAVKSSEGGITAQDAGPVVLGNAAERVGLGGHVTR